MFSCSTNPELQLEELQVRNQQYVISSQRDTIIEGIKGTRIYIPAGAFQSKSDSLSVDIKECYELSDMVREGLSTYSDGKVLSSNGMINIRVFDGDNEVSLSDGKKLIIQFPKSNESKDMALFYADSVAGQMNWTIDSSQQFSVVIASIHRENNWGVTSSDRFLIDNMTIDRWSMMNGRRNAFYFFVALLNEEGLVDSIVNVRNIDEDIFKTINEYFSNNRDVLQGSFRSFTANQRYLVSILGKGHQYVSNKDFLKTFSQTYGDSLETIPVEDLEYYIFSSAKLGWINCDYFIDYPDGSADIVVEGETEDIVSLVIKGTNSCLNGVHKDGKHVFQNIPVGTSATFIGIRSDGGTTSFCSQEFIVEKNTPLKPVYNEIRNLEELDLLIKKLDSGT